MVFAAGTVGVLLGGADFKAAFRLSPEQSTKA